MQVQTLMQTRILILLSQQQHPVVTLMWRHSSLSTALTCMHSMITHCEALLHKVALMLWNSS